MIGEELIGKYVLVRCHAAGVFVGTLEKRQGREVHLKNGRCLWEWDGAYELIEISQLGVKNPENCRFTLISPDIYLLEAIEILPVSEIAQKCIESVEEWCFQTGKKSNGNCR